MLPAVKWPRAGAFRRYGGSHARAREAGIGSQTETPPKRGLYCPFTRNWFRHSCGEEPAVPARVLRACSTRQASQPARHVSAVWLSSPSRCSIISTLAAKRALSPCGSCIPRAASRNNATCNANGPSPSACRAVRKARPSAFTLSRSGSVMSVTRCVLRKEHRCGRRVPIFRQNIASNQSINET